MRWSVLIETTEIFIWIPKSKTYRCKVTINDNDETSNVIESSFKMSATVGIGNFKVKMLNPDGILSKVYKEGDIVKFFGDIEDGTKLQFVGRVDYAKNSISQDGEFLELEGRHISYILTEVLVNESFVDTEVSEILKALISKYTQGFTYNNVQATDKIISITWNYRPFWDCVKTLCSYVNYDCYVDNQKDFHFFPANSILNTDEAIVEGDNLIKNEDWGKDIYYERTRVMVMGEDDVGMPILYTAEVGTGEEAREIFIKDTSANTYEQVKSIAEAKLVELTNIPPQAKVTALGLVDIAPGDNIWVSIPRQEIHGIYKILEYTHKFGRKGWQTECLIEKEIKGVEQILEERVRKEVEIQDAKNPNKMFYSFNFTFNDSKNIQTMVGCKIENGKLKLQYGETTGIMLSKTIEHKDNISKLELRYEAVNIGDSVIQVSVNGGLNWEVLPRGVLFEPSFVGNKLRVKVTLNSTSLNPSPEIDSLAVFYS